MQLKALREERENLVQARQQVDEEVNTLRRVVQQHEQESKNRQSMLENKIMELETLTKTLPRWVSRPRSVGTFFFDVKKV